MRVRSVCVGFLVVLLGACPGPIEPHLCDNRMDSSFLLSNLDASYTVRPAQKCNANFAVKGTLAALDVKDPNGEVVKKGEVRDVNFAVLFKGSDCTTLATSGTGADRVIVRKGLGGSCIVSVPFQAVSGLLKGSFQELWLKAELVAVADPTRARCMFKGPPVPTNVGIAETENKGCQLPFD